MSGAAGSNECPAGSVRIEAEAACRAAATAAGKTPSTFGFVATSSTYPRGCYYDTSFNYAQFNPHAVGAGNPSYQLLCAAVTTGAPHRCAHKRINIYIDIYTCRSFLVGSLGQRTIAQAAGCARACRARHRKGTQNVLKWYSQVRHYLSGTHGVLQRVLRGPCG